MADYIKLEREIARAVFDRELDDLDVKQAEFVIYNRMYYLKVYRPVIAGRLQELIGKNITGTDSNAIKDYFFRRVPEFILIPALDAAATWAASRNLPFRAIGLARNWIEVGIKLLKKNCTIQDRYEFELGPWNFNVFRHVGVEKFHLWWGEQSNES